MSQSWSRSCRKMRRALFGNDRGAALLSVLLFLTLTVVVTSGVMSLVQADLTAGIRQQQAVQVFNLAEAGIHYAIARMQISGAASYAGETITITDAGTSIGTATLQVQCLVSGISPALNQCAGLFTAYRQITSTGALVVPGPRRVITAIVEGTTSVTANWAICGYDGVSLDQGTHVYGDVGTNGNLSLSVGGGNVSRICDSTPGVGCVGPAPPPSQAYSGSAYAVGTITCGSGPCNSSQIEGTIAPNQPVGSVCPAVTLTPPSAASEDPADDLTVTAGSTVTLDPSRNYRTVQLNSAGGGASCPALVTDRATLVIDSGADPNGTVVVRMRQLRVGRCARLVITGSGKVELWILEPPATPADYARQAVLAERNAIFGSTTTGVVPSAIAGDRFTINVLSNKQNGDPGDCLSGSSCGAVHFDQAGLVAGTFVVPDGGLTLNQSAASNGAMLARHIRFDQGTVYSYDPRSRLGGPQWGNFNLLRSWSDQ